MIVSRNRSGDSLEQEELIQKVRVSKAVPRKRSRALILSAIYKSPLLRLDDKLPCGLFFRDFAQSPRENFFNSKFKIVTAISIDSARVTARCALVKSTMILAVIL